MNSAILIIANYEHEKTPMNAYLTTFKAFLFWANYEQIIVVVLCICEAVVRIYVYIPGRSHHLRHDLKSYVLRFHWRRHYLARSRRYDGCHEACDFDHEFGPLLCSILQIGIVNIHMDCHLYYKSKIYQGPVIVFRWMVIFANELEWCGYQMTFLILWCGYIVVED